jgi:hypothetical protein
MRGNDSNVKDSLAARCAIFIAGSWIHYLIICNNNMFVRVRAELDGHYCDYFVLRVQLNSGSRSHSTRVPFRKQGLVRTEKESALPQYFSHSHFANG